MKLKISFAVKVIVSQCKDQFLYQISFRSTTKLLMPEIAFFKVQDDPGFLGRQFLMVLNYRTCVNKGRSRIVAAQKIGVFYQIM